MNKRSARYTNAGIAAAALWLGGVAACNSVLGFADFDANGCPAKGAKQCGDLTTPQVCDASGQWQWEEPCQFLCNQGECTGVCVPGGRGCSANTPQTCDPSGQWQNVVDGGACMNSTCDPGTGECVGECAPGKRCVDNTPRSCDAKGQWLYEMPCTAPQHCEGGICVVECAPGDLQCFNNTLQMCDAKGYWQDETACMNQTCLSGACVGECELDQTQCAGNMAQKCDGNGQWVDVDCGNQNQTCVSGACTGVCAPGQAQCIGQTPQSCGANGQWADGTACPDMCAAGLCITAQSCTGLGDTCGPLQNENCCAGPWVADGMFNRSNHPSYPATVTPFQLDRFEITVGRFRKFVEAYPGSKPAAGAGAHPLIVDSGWDAAWDGSLPVDRAALEAAVKCYPVFQTWTDNVGANENLPMNCINWYVAFAFCAWDSGRLPTEVEWNYAAAGGDEQRMYPWSNPSSSTPIDATYAVYDCLGDGNPEPSNCSIADILDVGSKPLGDGRWGHADLGGNMWEWTLDWYGAYGTPCDSCANLQPGSYRVFRGGSWYNLESVLFSSGRYYYAPAVRSFGLGARCVRML